MIRLIAEKENRTGCCVIQDRFCSDIPCIGRRLEEGFEDFKKYHVTKSPMLHDPGIKSCGGMPVVWCQTAF